jgi:hypothetical protein
MQQHKYDFSYATAEVY